ncbi:unnamed protein product [Phyllotreta striolata]|uniref:Uncharacterized protein n=1 Tax=Phyllotreta striolata TaxID=444603 RepID=A0A9N9XTT0_PHYSR|nr:unnamed protein product [Phyllotreta striolata]
MAESLAKLQKLIESNFIRELSAKKKVELTEAKFKLDNELRLINAALNSRQKEYDIIRNATAKLRCEVPVWQEKAKNSKILLETSVRQVFEEHERTRCIQSDLWENINDWVSASNQRLHQKDESDEHPANKEIGASKAAARMLERRSERILQARLQGEAEALRAFEKHQTAKIQEIDQITSIGSLEDSENFEELPEYLDDSSNYD